MKVTLLFVTVFCFARGHKVVMINQCPFSVWPAMWNIKGSSDFNPQVANGGLKNGDMMHFNPSDDWYGLIWPRTNCVGGYCETGDCAIGSDGTCREDSVSNVSATLAGIKFNELYPHGYDDQYFINIEDGFNVPVSITPVPGTYRGRCGRVQCNFKLSSACPSELAERNINGQTIACLSPCKKFQTEEHCCHGTYGNCKTSEMSDPDYSRTFKQICPEAQAKAHDTTSLRCTGLLKQSSRYEIKFCP